MDKFDYSTNLTANVHIIVKNYLRSIGFSWTCSNPFSGNYERISCGRDNIFVSVFQDAGGLNISILFNFNLAAVIPVSLK